MSISDMFKEFLSNLTVERSAQFSQRYGEITKSLNLKFRSMDSKTLNSLQVGSYGRYTGIKGISDLDMLYIMPASQWNTYKDGNQSKLLTDVRDAIKSRYPTTKVRVDRLVVTVTYQNFHIEVQPVFEEYDQNGQSYFQYPDSYNGGSWKTTKPRQEMKAVKDLNDAKNKNLRLLCKMIRAWKNKHGVPMGGLLIDTLAYNFLNSTTDYDDKSYLYFDWLSRDFFKYMSELPKQTHFKAPGSNQNVRVKKSFQKKAQDTYDLCLKAIDAKDNSHDEWRKVYGRNFPVSATVKEAMDSTASSWANTEQFIDDFYPIDLQYSIRLDCDVSQNGFRPNSLINMIANKIPLLANKNLFFKVVDCDVPGDYSLKWKVLNRGTEAKKRNQIRGQIIDDQGSLSRRESTSFSGEHIVECYAIKDGYVVALASIDVPIR